MKNTIIIFLLLIIVTGCKNDDDCFSYRKVGASEVNAPDTGTVNEEISIEVSFMAADNCGTFSKFITTGTEKDRIIETEGKFDNCNMCTHAPEIRKANYRFTPTATGVYRLRFASSSDNYIEKEIQVN